MTDLERAQAMMRNYPPTLAEIAQALAAARLEGAEEARKQAEGVIEGFAHRWKQTGAAEMRERAARLMDDMFGDDVSSAIRALPLTPEEA